VPIVLDIGSVYSKVGFAGDDAPKHVFPTIMATNQKEPGTLVGNEAIDYEQTPDWSCSNPVEYGYPGDYEDMEQVYRFAVAQLGVEPKDQPILMVYPYTIFRTHQEELTEIMFECLEASGLYTNFQSNLSLYASGRINGISLQMGGGLTQAVVVIEGCSFPHSYGSLDVAGSDLSAYMATLCKGRGSSPMYRRACTDIKENFCYVAQDYEQEIQNATKMDEQALYKLPDGEIIRVSAEERIKCPEALFNPKLCGMEGEGIHHLINKSITGSGPGIHSELYEKIVLFGGGSLFPGLAGRLTKEIQALAPQENVKVIAPPERMWSSWIGGSILGSLCSMHSRWITKEEYAESGAEIIHQKCF